MNSLLSKRCEISSNWEDIFERNLSMCNNNPFHETNNIEGYINLSTAMNCLCDDIIGPKVEDNWICDYYSLGYKDYNNSTIRLRNAMAKMMTEFLDTREPISPGNLFCFSGVTSSIDMLCHCLADPGEVFLVPTPMYSRAHKDCMQRSNVDLFPVHVIDEYEDGIPHLTIEKITDAYKSAIITDNVVRGILLTNPNCPLGDTYSPKFLMDVIKFCNEKNIHLIINEVYALSTFSFSPNEKFHSTLQFSEICNPNTTHVIYGLSKDFGLAGLRIGVIHTKCKELQKTLIKQSFAQTLPYNVMDIASEVFEDLPFWRQYVKEYQTRLTESYIVCFKFLRELGVKVKESSAGLFLWIDLRNLCGSTFEGERNLTDFLLEKCRLYVGPGEEVFCAQAGWFRIAFTRKRLQMLIGLKRLEVGLNIYKYYKPCKLIKNQSCNEEEDSD